MYPWKIKQVIHTEIPGSDLEAVHRFLHGSDPELIHLLTLCQLCSEPLLISLLCAPGTWDAGKLALEELEEHSGASWSLQLVDLGWSSGSARLRSMELIIVAVLGGMTGERVPYYCDPFFFERFVRWGYLQGCLCTPTKSVPRTWSAAKYGAQALGFCLCAAGFVCLGFSIIWLFPSPTILDNGKLN